MSDIDWTAAACAGRTDLFYDYVRKNDHTAMAIIARQRGEARVYYCEAGESWHVTSKPNRRRPT